MEKMHDCARAIAELVKDLGNQNGQRWHVSPSAIMPVLEVHLGVGTATTSEPGLVADLELEKPKKRRTRKKKEEGET